MLGTVDLLQLAVNQNLADAGGQVVNGSGVVVYGGSFPMPDSALLGWWLQFASPGVVAVKVELEQAQVRPATEGAADGNYVVPDSISSAMFASVEDELLHGTSYAPVVSKFGRLKMTGLAGNNSATALTLAELEIRRT